jgi:hypothetical protein
VERRTEDDGKAQAAQSFPLQAGEISSAEDLVEFTGVLEQGTVYRTEHCRVTISESGIKHIDCGSERSHRPRRGDEPSVREISWQAVEQLRLPAPVIQMSPAEDAFQVVGVPTWLWVEASVWKPVSETVGVPGTSVTATAIPRNVVWSMGEGGQVICHGPGTPYNSSYPAADPSPDCGSTYTRSSLNEAGEKFTVTAALTWHVTWEGGGASGDVPGLVTLDEIDVLVDEMQALVVNSS